MEIVLSTCFTNNKRCCVYHSIGVAAKFWWLRTAENKLCLYKLCPSCALRDSLYRESGMFRPKTWYFALYSQFVGAGMTLSLSSGLMSIVGAGTALSPLGALYI